MPRISNAQEQAALGNEINEITRLRFHLECHEGIKLLTASLLLQAEIA